jgi:hypothetical protein
MTTHISVRVSDEELDYLKKVAYENELFKNDNDPSESKGLKHLLKQLIIDEKHKSGNENSPELQHLIKLTEQINVILPHLFHNSKVASMCLLGMIKDSSTAEKVYKDSLQTTVNVCGQIQDSEYKKLFVAADKNNMKTIPIEKERNQWK